jgi:hypothetical protein
MYQKALRYVMLFMHSPKWMFSPFIYKIESVEVIILVGIYVVWDLLHLNLMCEGIVWLIESDRKIIRSAYTIQSQ